MADTSVSVGFGCQVSAIDPISAGRRHLGAIYASAPPGSRKEGNPGTLPLSGRGRQWPPAHFTIRVFCDTLNSCCLHGMFSPLPCMFVDTRLPLVFSSRFIQLHLCLFFF